MSHAQTTTVGEFSAGPSRRYSLSDLMSDSVSCTQGVRESRRANILAIVPSYDTEPQELEGSRRFWVQSTETPVPVAAAPISRSVDGVVDIYDEVSVQCRLRVGSSTVTIQLPRPLFPQAIRHGLPVSLEMIDDQGIRKPRISVREIQPHDVAGIAEEFDAIIAAL